VALNPNDYRGRCTLILGDVNSGKTRLTAEIVAAFIAAGHAARIAIVDLAPDRTGAVGGKLVPPDPPVRYLTCPILAPRLTGRNDDEIQALAEANAARIEPLFEELWADPPSILVVNDATLYLQAGSPRRFLTLLGSAATAVVNAYCGAHFAEGPLSRRERELTADLTRRCDRVIRLPSSR
jgi:hypothetical protein